MNESIQDAVVDELIEKAVSHLERVAVQLGDALENLENREVLGAIGALTGCEEAINRANLVLIIARDYGEKLARAQAAVIGSKSKPENIGKAQAIQQDTAEADAGLHSAVEVLLPEAEFDKLAAVDLIASGYEFNCPACNTYNTLIAIPKTGKAVQCHNCHVQFKVAEVTHADE